MTEIRPFRAVHYDPAKVGNLAKVVCPPYDVISPQQQTGYYNQSEFNFIRLILNKELETDDKNNNRYTRAKKFYEDWLSQGILKEDDTPAIYYYRQEYKIQGTRYSRLGFIALMKIQDNKSSKIYPHENTHSKAKEDRLRLIKAVNSNMSPIFVCFSDKTKKVENIFNEDVAPSQPFVDIVDDQDVRHIAWRLTDPKRIKEIVDALDNQPLFIADGHHRYEVAKEYRRLKLERQEKSSGREPFNYVMTYFTNMDISRNLTIFPIHRIIGKLPGKLDFLEEYFRIDRIKSKSDLQIMVAKAGLNEPAFGLYQRGDMKLLRLKNKLLIDKIVKEGSKEFRRLDATILKYFILERVGVKSEDITYTNDFQEAANMVDEGRADASFIMNSVRIKQIRDIALNGERMPPKTTFFYPKLLSGLTVYKMV